MQWSSLVAMVLAAPTSALIRFQCSQLVHERLDPLVHPGVAPTPHLHQIVGGNAFAATMDPNKRFIDNATCTTCQFSEDFSNYWTAVMYFKARNGTYKRVPQIPNVGFEGARGGITVYYMTDSLVDNGKHSKVTAFKQGFRMFVGNPEARSLQESKKFRQLTYTCLDTVGTRYPEIRDFPKKSCRAGIMVNVRFPTCWDGKNLDSPDHMSHMSYPANGTFENLGPCPASHPVRTPQVMYETLWDTRQFNDPSIWPEDGSQPFIWSYGDNLGYGNHGDYVFGWKDDSLQKIMDTPCYIRCPGAKMQSIAEMNKCSQKPVVADDIDGWVASLPGGGAHD